MELKQLLPNDPAVQEFLWKHLVPSHFRWDYTKLDAMKLVERQVYDGDVQLWGDMSVGFVFRAVVRNPKVIEPHIMGNGIYLRSALRAGLPICWGLGFEKIVIWTQHESIANIAEKMGFTRHAMVPRVNMDASGELQPMYAVTLEKTDAV